MPIFDDRFARQNRCEPPPEFPLASPCAGIVHHLSGPNGCAPTQTFQHMVSWLVGGAREFNPSFPPSHFHYAPWFVTITLAHTLDSLVRVSRRAGDVYFVSISALQFATHTQHHRHPRHKFLVPRMPITAAAHFELGTHPSTTARHRTDTP